MGELLLLIGTCYNLLLVILCSRLLDERISLLRALSCSFLSAFCSIAIGNTLWSTLISLLLLLVAFPSKNRLLKKLTYLFLATFLLGGMLTAVQSYATTTRQFYTLLGVGSLLFFILITVIWYKVHVQLLLKRYSMHCFVKFDGHSIPTIGFLDTGNQSVEPLTGRPVHYATIELLKEMPDLQQSFMQWSNTKAHDVSMFQKTMQKRLRHIFVDTVTGSEVVLAMRCTICLPDVELEEQYIVFVQQPLQFQPEAQLVLNAAVLQHIKK